MLSPTVWQDLAPVKPKIKRKSRICERVLEEAKEAILRLRVHVKQPIVQRYAQLLQVAPELCRGPERDWTLALLQRSLLGHTSKIGILSPLSGKHRHLGLAVRLGAEQALGRERGRLQVVDSRNILRGLGELLLVHESAVIIGGMSPAELRVVAPLTAALQTPFLVLNRQQAVGRWALQALPGDQHYAEALARYSRAKGFKRISFLAPLNPAKRKLCRSLRKSLVKQGLRVREEIFYLGGDYASMRRAVAKLARVSEEGVSQGLLSDAVFIPDHFRNVVSLAKLFSYYGVESLALLGTAEWRAEELIQEAEPLLEGAVFADFMGPYNRLPLGLRPQQLAGDFVPFAEAAAMDFKWAGYQVSTKVLRALKLSRGKRNRIIAALPQMQPGALAWKIHLFKVRQGRLALAQVSEH